MSGVGRPVTPGGEVPGVLPVDTTIMCGPGRIPKGSYTGYRIDVARMGAACLGKGSGYVSSSFMARPIRVEATGHLLGFRRLVLCSFPSIGERIIFAWNDVSFTCHSEQSEESHWL